MNIRPSAAIRQNLRRLPIYAERPHIRFTAQVNKEAVMARKRL